MTSQAAVTMPLLSPSDAVRWPERDGGPRAFRRVVACGAAALLHGLCLAAWLTLARHDQPNEPELEPAVTMVFADPSQLAATPSAAAPSAATASPAEPAQQAEPAPEKPPATPPPEPLPSVPDAAPSLEEGQTPPP